MTPRGTALTEAHRSTTLFALAAGTKDCAGRVGYGLAGKQHERSARGPSTVVAI